MLSWLSDSTLVYLINNLSQDPVDNIINVHITPNATKLVWGF